MRYENVDQVLEITGGNEDMELDMWAAAYYHDPYASKPQRIIKPCLCKVKAYHAHSRYSVQTYPFLSIMKGSKRLYLNSYIGLFDTREEAVNFFNGNIEQAAAGIEQAINDLRDKQAKMRSLIVTTTRRSVRR